MSVIENYNKRIPEYYDTMYLDGYTPNEIMMAAHKQFLRLREERNQIDTIKIISEVKVR